MDCLSCWNLVKGLFQNFRFVYGIVFVSAFVKLRKSTANIVMSVCPYGKIGLPKDGFL